MRQRADAHAQGVEAVEAAGEIIGDDGDEARCKAALRNEGGARRRSDFLHPAGGGHIFRQIKIMHAGLGSGFRDGDRQVEGRGAQHGVFAGEGCRQGRVVADVQRQRFDGRFACKGCQFCGRAVNDGDTVVAGAGEEAGDGGADLAGADDGNRLHVSNPSGPFRAL